MTITIDRPAPAVRDPRQLVPAEVFARLVRRVAKDEQLPQQLAERIMDQALAFLLTCAANPTAGLSPSALVDIGWHTFILHTSDYADFCGRTAGRFMHHNPTDGDTPLNASVLEATVAAMRDVGVPVDADLWRPGPADCSQCHAGCHDSPA
ncbi:MAG: hypothetical protein JWO67_4045 [Streptosporangiaceae bacterium]|nr:hypothetical protein [Streptosporangiaceae bacterium]